MKEIAFEVPEDGTAHTVQIMTCGSPECDHVHLALFHENALVPFASCSLGEEVIRDLARALLDVRNQKRGADFS